MVELSGDEIRAMLNDPHVQESVLFIIDGCDENVHQKQKLQKLITGKLYHYASLLVTARPALCNIFLKYFDTACVILGFTQSQMIQFVTKYAKVMNCSPKFVDNLKTAVSDGHDIQDISRNPLQLWFLCLLCEEHLEELPDTRSELYEMVTSLLINRGIIKYNLDLENVMKEVKVIHRLSCDAIQRGETFTMSDLGSVDADQISILLKLGLIVKECGPSKLHTHGRYTFPHKTFQEFFAAKHLNNLTHSQRYKYLKHNRDRRWDMVLIFLCGLLAQSDSPEIQQLFKSVLQKDLHSAIKVVDSKSVSSELHHHSRHHLGLQCLAECGFFSGFNSMEEYIVPPVYLHNALTCTYCLKGFVIVSGVLKRDHDLVINCMDCIAFMGQGSAIMQALRRMEKCPVLVLTNVGGQFIINDFLFQFMKSNLELKHLYIYLSPWVMSGGLPETQPQDDMVQVQARLLPDLESLVFQGCPSYQTPGSEKCSVLSSYILNYLLKNTGGKLVTLVLKDIKVTAFLFRQLLRVMGSEALICLILESIKLSHSQFQVLSSTLATSGTIKRLYVENLETVEHEHEALDVMLEIISACPIEELQVRAQVVSGSVVCGLMNYCASKDLTYLELSLVPFSLEMWRIFIEGVAHLEVLKRLILIETCLHNAPLLDFARAILSLPSLIKLDLSYNEIGPSKDFKEACNIIIQHKCLSILSIEGCNIGDDQLETVFAIWNKSKLTELYMIGNPIGSSDETACTISQKIDCCSTLKILHFTSCILTTKYLNTIADHLKSSNVEDLWISCLPCTGLIGPEVFFSIHKVFRSNVPRLQSFGFGVSLDIGSAREPTPELHAKWRTLCSS